MFNWFFRYSIYFLIDHFYLFISIFQYFSLFLYEFWVPLTEIEWQKNQNKFDWFFWHSINFLVDNYKLVMVYFSWYFWVGNIFVNVSKKFTPKYKNFFFSFINNFFDYFYVSPFYQVFYRIRKFSLIVYFSYKKTNEWHEKKVPNGFFVFQFISELIIFNNW